VYVRTSQGPQIHLNTDKYKHTFIKNKHKFNRFMHFFKKQFVVGVRKINFIIYGILLENKWYYFSKYI